MNGTAVRFSGVTKRYPHFVLEKISFDLPTGRIMGFIGANGAGKTTTLRILVGLVHQEAGTVTVLGHAMPEGGVAARRDIGYVAEDMRLYPSASIAWHMAFVAGIFPGWDARYADDLVARFDLRPEQLVKGLSHGQRIKATLLLALARRPRLLVLDEPTTGLDPVARMEVMGALADVLQDEDRTVLFSSQNIADIEQIVDRVTFIDRGRIVDSDDKETFLDRWRRLRLVVPQGVTLPDALGVVSIDRAGQLATLTTDRYDPALLAVYELAGARVHAVDRLTLEEVFVATVMARRAGGAA